jgi:hypothetical protein
MAPGREAALGCVVKGFAGLGARSVRQAVRLEVLAWVWRERRDPWLAATLLMKGQFLCTAASCQISCCWA